MNTKLDYKGYTDNIDNVLAYEEDTIFYIQLLPPSSVIPVYEGWLCKGEKGEGTLQLLKIMYPVERLVRQELIKYFFTKIYNEKTMASVTGSNPFDKLEENIPLEEHNDLKSITMRLLDNLTSMLTGKGTNHLELVALLTECKTLDLSIEQGV